jgi:hypothetical protein
MTVSVPSPRWGVRFTSNPDHNLNYLQQTYNEDTSAARRGELFLNEPLAELYFVGDDGVARRVGDITPVPFENIDFSGIREFSSDASAANAVPPVPVGGVYHYEGALRVRLV